MANNTIFLSNTHAMFDGPAFRMVSRLLTYKKPGYQFTAAYRRGGWNGEICLMRANGRFPAGLAPWIAAQLAAQGIAVDIDDQRPPDLPMVPEIANLPYTIELRPHQVDAVAAAEREGRGVIWHPAAAGKTEVMIELAHRLARPGLVLVHRKDLLNQTTERFIQRLGLGRSLKDFANQDVVGIVGDGHWRPKLITVATFQTLYLRLKERDRDVTRWLREDIAQVHVDEAHHLPAKSYEMVMACLISARYRFGYCLVPETKVLTQDLQWVPVGEVVVGKTLVGFEEQPTYGTTGGAARPRRLLPSTVLSAGRSLQHCYRITLSDGTTLTATDEHPWLVYPYESAQNLRWATTQELFHQRGRPWRMPRYFPLWEERQSRSAGFVAGAFDSEGSRKLRNGAMIGLSFTQSDNPTWKDTLQALAAEGIHYTTPPHGDRKGLRVACIPFYASMKLLGATRPNRLLKVWAASPWPSLYPHEKLRIVSVEDAGYREVVQLSTTTKTYISEGFASHNSATPWLEGDIETFFKVASWLGSTLHRIAPLDLADQGYITPATIFMIQPTWTSTVNNKDYPTAYRTGIIENESRNQAIRLLVERLAPSGQVLILCDRLEHGAALASRLDCPFVEGATSGTERHRLWEHFRQGRHRVLVATKVADEGIDVPVLSYLILAGTGKAAHLSIQRLGRGMRASPGKEELYCFDFADQGKYLAKHAKARLDTYRSEPVYSVEETTLEELLGRN